MTRLPMAFAAAGLEGMAAVAALHGAWALALALHAASAGCAAGWLRRLLEGPAGWSFALFFAAALFLPALGALGTAAVALAAPCAASASGPEVVHTRIPGPPRAEEFEAPRAAASEREAHLAAVAGLRGRNDPVAIAGLWRALEDPEEDVRLLAHSLLESKSRAADRRIHELSRELEAAQPFRRAAIHRRLALEHWELAWLGLVQGECLGHTLEAARLHALAALEGDRDVGPLHLLLGRIELRRGKAREAATTLLRAAELGLPAKVLRPYLAEAAFLARRFDIVRRQLAGAVGANETVDRVRRYWA